VSCGYSHPPNTRQFYLTASPLGLPGSLGGTETETVVMVLVVEPEVMVAKVEMRRISAREAVASYCISSGGDDDRMGQHRGCGWRCV
jgi:hypothetical protein